MSLLNSKINSVEAEVQEVASQVHRRTEMYTFDYKRPPAQADATAAFHGDARYLVHGPL